MILKLPLFSFLSRFIRVSILGLVALGQRWLLVIRKKQKLKNQHSFGYSSSQFRVSLIKHRKTIRFRTTHPGVVG
jgi:hypothetical protein